MVTSFGFYLTVIAAIGADRILELFIARRNANRAFAAGAIEVGQAHYPLMVAFHVAFLAACIIERSLRRHGPPPSIAWLAIVLELCAQMLRYWAIIALGARWNTRIVVRPELDPVTSGPYRLMRHPNYVAVAIEMVAVPAIGGAWFTAIVFSIGNALMMMVRIPAEERAMGLRYAGSFGKLPRFIPRIGHAEHRG